MFTKKSKVTLAIAAIVVVGLGGAYYTTQSHKEGGSSLSISSKKKSKMDSYDASMDLSAIKKGDFSSVVGTWKSANGNTFTFDKNGLVSWTYSGNTHSDYAVYTGSGSSNKPAPNEKDGVLSATMGPKTGLPEEAISASNAVFIPKGVTYVGNSDKVDRIFSGQSMDPNNFYTKVKETKESKAIDKLSNKEKQALVLLGMPDKFHSDYGETTPDMMLSGKLHTTIMTDNFHEVDSTFKGVKITQNIGGPSNEQMLQLQNVPDDISANNRADTKGVFTIDGDTVTYYTQGTRTALESETVRKGQVIGTKSLSKLYKEYKGTNKFKQMQDIIVS